MLNAILPGHYCFYNTSRHILWSWRRRTILSFSQSPNSIQKTSVMRAMGKQTSYLHKHVRGAAIWQSKFICFELLKMIFLRFMVFFCSTFLSRLPRFHSSDVSKDELPWGKLGMLLRHGRDGRKRQIVQEGWIYRDSSRSISITLREHLHVMRHEGDMS